MPTTQKAINRAFSELIQKLNQQDKHPLLPSDRYIIFSDHHKGARNEADDFLPCEQTYLAALDHYLDEGYTLIILGDAEELWEEKAQNVLAAYKNVLLSETRFYKEERYIRVYGNHDDLWRYPTQVKKHLDPFFPGIQVQDGILFEYTSADGLTGELFLTHGHQGTLDSDKLAWFSRIWLPLYREFQILTGIGKTTPAKDACLRAEHDTKMYRWTQTRRNTILIVGHTHRPIWSSQTHLEKLLNQLYTLRQKNLDEPSAATEEEIVQLKDEIKRRELKYPPCTDTIKTRPSYFNTGCCRFEDGDITGIELDNGQIRLIKWTKSEAEFVRLILEETPLSEVFFFLEA
ncbi:MAG: metallophosphoesterase family protein [Ardenticatenaceae bacterium]|nr:metallophosphoesterase family protein [Ardenticatenaceae bacterium]MCB9443695.1 metallophosphoesterase family protein [Ardenticatenaceae bacterium]